MSHTRTHVRANPLWVCGLAMFCVGAGVPHAFAAVPDLQGTSLKVKFGDLNLANSGGVETLYKRIERAARRVCDIDSEQSDPSRQSHWRYCYKTAVANAVQDVNNQNLTAMHREKNKESSAG
jgi:UrcA family protein